MSNDKHVIEGFQAEPEVDFSDEAIAAQVDDVDEWETVIEDSGVPIEFQKFGDQFIGRFEGERTITPPDGTKESFTQQMFRDDGVLYVMSGGYKLRAAFKDIAIGTRVRITYVRDVQTGQPSPMRDFRVEAAKRRSA